MNGAQLLKLGQMARLTVESAADRQLQQADLADSFVQCAAYLLDKGEYTHALQLCRRAGEVCPSYAGVHSDLGGAQ